MKSIKCLLIVCFTFLSLNSFSQSANKVRLDEINIELAEALEKGDYDKAAKLKEEKTIRLEIEEAIINQDFEKAEKLKASLEAKSTDEEQQPKETTQSTNPTSKKEIKPVEEASGKPGINSKNIYFYMDFGIGAATIDSFYSKYLYSGTGISPSTARLAIDLKIGTKFYFNAKDSKMRIGLDVNWLSLNPQLGGYVAPALNLSILKPGFAFAYSFNDKIGIDAAFNLGTNLFFHPDESIFAAGLNLNPHVKFQMRKFCVGFEYQSQLHLTDSFKTNMFALTAGLKL